MECKICNKCNFEKHFKDFNKKYTECKDCNFKKGLKRYQKSKDKVSNQQKIYYEKNIEKILTKQND